MSSEVLLAFQVSTRTTEYLLTSEIFPPFKFQPELLTTYYNYTKSVFKDTIIPSTYSSKPPCRCSH